MPYSRFTMRVVFVLLIFVTLIPSTGQAQRRRKKRGDAASPLEKVVAEHSLSADQIDSLVGQQANLLLTTGHRLTDVTIKDLWRPRDRDRVRGISFKEQPNEKSRSKRAKVRKVPGKKLFRIEVAGRFYDLRLIGSQKAYALIDIEARNKAIQERLEVQGRRLWQPIPEEEQQQHVAEYKDFLKTVKEHFRQLPLQFHETQYFLFMTDMPPGDIGPYLRQLDVMNEKLGEAFGFAPGENVWRGKAVVIVFIEKTHFVEFETEFMENIGTDPSKQQGLCHSFRDGKVVVSAYRGDDSTFLAKLLVHETAHGYVHRYKSNNRIPSWLNEGIADWIAAAAVPTSKNVQNRQKQAAERLRMNPTLGGQFYSARQIEAWQYGTASSMVDLLVRGNSDAFRVFFDGIKEGLTWQDSLQRAYGATPEDLATLYGRAIGVPNLTP